MGIDAVGCVGLDHQTDGQKDPTVNQGTGTDKLVFSGTEVTPPPPLFPSISLSFYLPVSLSCALYQFTLSFTLPTDSRSPLLSELINQTMRACAYARIETR